MFICIYDFFFFFLGVFRILKSFCGARDEVQELEDQLDAATSLRHDLFDHLKFLYDNKFALEKSQKLLGRLKNCLGKK